MKSMVYDEKRRLGIGSGYSKPGGFDVESLVRAQIGHAATKCAQSRRKRFHHTRWNSNSDNLRVKKERVSHSKTLLPVIMHIQGKILSMD